MTHAFPPNEGDVYGVISGEMYDEVYLLALVSLE